MIYCQVFGGPKYLKELMPIVIITKKKPDCNSQASGGCYETYLISWFSTSSKIAEILSMIEVTYRGQEPSFIS